ncbi:MAG: hypothetical protein NT166_19875 [Candidatus Aminicenantes bacterium]|nr:hypothetical protein [Candidatus Aminicenantes bacterium]
MEQIETYIYEEGEELVFLGRGKFNAMPRVGETIFPINEKLEGKVTRISNWNYNNGLTWEGITCIFVDSKKEVDYETIINLGNKK